MSQPFPASSKVTMADVARESDVSPATVSLVLRDKPGVGAETRQRVLDTAQAMGYIYTSSAQADVNDAVKTIGVVVKVGQDDPLPEANSFYAAVLSGIETICRKNQTNLMYATMPVDDHNNPIEMPRLLTDPHIDGLLLVGMQFNDTIMALLRQQDTPVVLVDAYAPENPYDAVTTDNQAGAYQATTFLIQQGHQHIAIVGSEPDAYPSILERRAGYLQALTEHNLTPYFVDCSLWSVEVPSALKTALKQHPQISAVFGCNDDVAIAVMQTAQSLGRRIPDDLSVIGFDNILLAQHITPALTTMRVDKLGMGRMAAQLLLNRVEYPEAGNVRGVITPRLIERQSTQPT